MKDPPGSNPIPHPSEKTITLTLTSPAPGGQPTQQIHTQGPGGQIGTPLIVSSTNVIPSVQGGLGGLTPSSSTGSIQHGPVSIHYAGSGITGPAISQCIQPKAPTAQNFVLGAGGPPLLVSGGAVLPGGQQTISGLAAVTGTPTGNSATHGNVIPPYASSLGNPIQASLTKLPQQAPTTQSYVVSSGGGVCGPDSGDESVSVSIHVTNNITATPVDPGAGADHAGGQSEVCSYNDNDQRLKVEDALNYLDQVKYKFGNQPQVYNDFLDIMKEFKSQSIDTPGVISRVSHLFRGHPELIMGFNTFLPPGYKIEVQMGEQLPIGSMGHGMNYKVTTVHTSGLVNQHSTQIIQHSGPSLPVRSTVTHTTHPTGNANLYVATGNVTNQVNTLGSVSIGNARALSPVPTLPSGGNNFENVGGSAFTHSLASPFVQNAFPTLQSQPVEFNHAINYVNKIKNRFHNQPEKYKQFLEILHTYQKEQRNAKDGNVSKHLTEHEVYNQVAKLFENQEDLLQEFGQFLPDATPPQPPPPVSAVNTTRQNHAVVKEVKRPLEESKKQAKARQEFSTSAATASQSQPAAKPAPAPKRALLNPALPAAKKVKYTSSFKDVSLAEAAKYGTLNDFAFFDKVRHVLRSNEVYDNFLRGLQLYNIEVISRHEVLQLLTNFLSRAPELLAWFKDFIGHHDQASSQQYEPIQSVSKQEKLTEEQVLEIDFSTCKRLGASYCALPKNHVPPKCSGRTALCKEVLNDVWVSFPTWSEDSTFVTSRKTQFEEYIYRCEDERFELDVVIETNTETIRCLEAVSKKMSRMSQEELQEFQLDDCLGGTSPTIHQRAIRRLYGEKASDIIEGLKRLPTMTVPMVLRRLKAKEEEWREAQKGFNKIWREQVERFYLKSLDHQGINFKQGDIRALRSKALITEIETIYDERQEQNAVETATDSQPSEGPHLILPYRNREVLDDACNLLLHHVRRQSGIQKEDKRKIKQILKRCLPDLFNHPRMDMSDDENEEENNPRSPNEILMNGIKNNKKFYGSTKRNNGKGKKDDESEQGSEGNTGATGIKGGESRRGLAKRDLKLRLEEKKRQKEDECLDEAHKMSAEELRILRLDSEQLEKYTFKHNVQDENYKLFFANNTWYVFMRLHQILCERLTKLLETALILANSEAKDSRDSKNSAAIALRLKPKPEIEVQDYYPTFIDMVKNLLDGNIETNNYEDQLREMFGIHAYIAYTMDKVVANAVRQLQNLVTDEGCQKCLEYYLYADRKGGTGGPISSASERVREECLYQCRSEKAFGEENCMKIVIFEKNCEMTMELLDGEPLQPNAEEQADWLSYVQKFAKPDGSDEQTIGVPSTNPSFLKRNRRKPITMDDVKVEPDTIKTGETEDEGENPSPVKIKDENAETEVTHSSSLQCSFNPSSYKMVYVCDGEDYLYRNRALPRAQETHKSVTTGMWKKFEKWHEDWLLKNTTRKDRSDCEAWLKENPKNEADVRAKKILKVITSDKMDAAPYHQFKKYVIISSTSSDKH